VVISKWQELKEGVDKRRDGRVRCCDHEYASDRKHDQERHDPPQLAFLEKLDELAENLEPVAQAVNSPADADNNHEQNYGRNELRHDDKQLPFRWEIKQVRFATLFSLPIAYAKS